MTSSTTAESLPAPLVAVIVYVPSKLLFRPKRVRLNRSPLKLPVRLEKVVVKELVGMLKLFQFKSLKVHWMFSVWTSGESPEMVKAKVTLISLIPTILLWTACTVGGTEGGGGRKERTKCKVQKLYSGYCGLMVHEMRQEAQCGAAC